MNVIRALAILALACLTIVSAVADSYPSKPIKIVVSRPAA